MDAHNMSTSFDPYICSAPIGVGEVALIQQQMFERVEQAHMMTRRLCDRKSPLFVDCVDGLLEGQTRILPT